MKISSVSKKVLASALSAAMVVAFAPAVAMADVHNLDKVNVKFDTTGLTLKDGSSAIADQADVAVTENSKVSLGSDVTANHEYRKGKQSVGGWYWDVDGDGKYNADTDVELVNSVLDFNSNSSAKAAVADGSTITLSPKYADSSKVKLDVENLTVPQQQTDISHDGTLSIPMAVASSGLNNARVSIAKDGTELAHSVVDLTSDVDQLAFSFQESTGTSASMIEADKWGAGTYTVTVKDTDKDEVAATAEFDVIEVSLGGVFSGNTTNKKVLAVVGTSWANTLNHADVEQAYDKVTTETGRKGVDGYQAGSVDVVTYDTTKDGSSKWVACKGANRKDAAVEAGQSSLTAVYSHDAKLGAEYINGCIVASVQRATEGGSVEDWDSSAEFTYELTGPNGLTRTVTGDDGKELYDFGSATTPAGTYTVKASVVEHKNDPTKAKTTDLGSCTFEASTVTFDAGTSGVASVKSCAFQNNGEESLYDVVECAKVTVNDVDPTKATFCGWSLDGTHVITSADVVAAGTATVALKAVYHTIADELLALP